MATLVELAASRHPMERGWVVVEEVSDDKAARRADLVAIYCWGKPYAVGYEIKATRADWLREMDVPEKRAWIEDTCRVCWFVCEPGVAFKGEIPDGWGLLERHGGKLRRIRAAPSMDCAGLPRWLTRQLHNQARGLKARDAALQAEEAYRPENLEAKLREIREAQRAAENTLAEARLAADRAREWQARLVREVYRAAGLCVPETPSIESLVRAFEAKTARRVLDQARYAWNALDCLVKAAEANTR